MSTTNTTAPESGVKRQRILEQPRALTLRVRELHALHAGAARDDQADLKHSLSFAFVRLDKACGNEPLPPSDSTVPGAPREDA